MKDRYNLNLLPIEDELDDATSSHAQSSGGAAYGTMSSAGGSTELLPGMGIDKEMMEQMKQG